MMKKTVILIGVGEMGGVFARGLLAAGYPVFPVLRDMDIHTVAGELPDPELVIVAVAEKDLHPTLESIPGPWRDRLLLLQNELLPNDWQSHDLANPTVISVWFEKKKGQDFKVLIPSPVHGPHSRMIEEALASLDIPTKILLDDNSLLFELVLKNVYILTTNIAGLEVGGTVGELWQHHQDLMREVAEEIMQLQAAMTGTAYEHQFLIDGMLKAFEGDMAHKCMGRSAPARLQRALETAEKFRLHLPRCEQISAKLKA